MKYALLNSLWIILLGAAANAHGEGNLIRNPGFEFEGESNECALHWRLNNPDDHGDAWGTAIRTDWRAHEGRYIGAIRGSWAGVGEYGGFWQEAGIEAGATYRAVAWFWADHSWRAGHQELKLEFWNGDRTELLAEQSVRLDDIGENWTSKELTGTAPEGASWGRVVINVGDAGHHGALQVDGIVLEVAP